MQRITTTTDFKIRLVLSDPDGNPFILDGLDFDIWLHTRPGSQPYLAARQSGSCRRCAVMDDNSSILVTVDAHTFRPGRLRADMSLHLLDCSHPDDYNDILITPDLGIEITEPNPHTSGASNLSGPVTVNVTIPKRYLPAHHHITREELDATIDRHVVDITAGNIDDIIALFTPSVTDIIF